MSKLSAFSLLEVLISLLVVSIGLLGLAGLQLQSLRNSRTAYEQSLAVTQLTSMLDRLRVNQTSTSRQKEFLEWNTLNQRLLPDGAGAYSCHNSQCTVSLSWGSRDKQMLELQARI